jgi:hypothetical protein
MTEQSFDAAEISLVLFWLGGVRPHLLHLAGAFDHARDART